ncbi:MAG: peptidyl-tRNA hydrolase Pth2 [archaeon]
MYGEVKQVIVLRSDLKMSKGKSSAQASHASVSAFIQCKKSSQEAASKWLESGQKKVVVSARSESSLRELHKKAEMAGLCSAIIEDAGRTELEPGTLTALAIGPADGKEIDRITGSLPLY